MPHHVKPAIVTVSPCKVVRARVSDPASPIGAKAGTQDGDREPRTEDEGPRTNDR